MVAYWYSFSHLLYNWCSYFTKGADFPVTEQCLSTLGWVCFGISRLLESELLIGTCKRWFLFCKFHNLEQYSTLLDFDNFGLCLIGNQVVLSQEYFDLIGKFMWYDVFAILLHGTGIGFSWITNAEEFTLCKWDLCFVFPTPWVSKPGWMHYHHLSGPETRNLSPVISTLNTFMS